MCVDYFQKHFITYILIIMYVYAFEPDWFGLLDAQWATDLHILWLNVQPHTSWISCSSDNWRWLLLDISTSLRWSSSSRWAKRPRISASSLRAASVCWLSAFSWAWELSFSLAAWRVRGEWETGRGWEGKWRMTNEGGGRWRTKTSNNDESERKNDGETEGEKHMQYQLLHW